MMKFLLLATAAALSAPALAQTAPTTGSVVDGSAAGAQVTPQSGAVTDPATTPAAASPAPVTGAAGIAQVVNTEFPTYDKNADGKLNKAEFTAWMVALRSAGDPKTDPASPAVKTWVSGAFASADADKNKEVSKDELTGFLVKGQS